MVIETYAASDEDLPAQTLTWSLEGDDSGDFVIGSSNGELKFAAVPDFEMPAGSPAMMNGDADNTYEITVKVTDNGSPVASATQDIIITVNDVNEPPVISTKETTDTARSFLEIEFDVDTSTLTDADYEVHDYDAVDPDDGATLAWSVSGTDAASFDINSDGKLSFKTTAIPDYEDPADVADSMMMGADDNIYKIVVEVTDGLDDSGSSDTTVDDMIEVTVTVTNVDEAPEITTTDAMTHVEPSFMEIEFDTPDADLSATARDIATYMARDEEGETITWSVAGTDLDDFEIGSTSGTLSFKNRPNYEMPTDREDTTENYLANDNKYQIIVKATDGTTDPNTDPKTRELPVTVTVTNVDETPEFTNPPDNRDFPEIEYDFTGTPDLVVATFTARDEENEDLTWDLSGSDAPDFTITENMDGEGVVSFNAAPDFEMPAGTPADSMDPADNTYEFTVVITDATDPPNTDANEQTLDYVVTVTDVNERPDIVEITDDAVEFAEVDFYSTDTPATVHTFTATDYDGDTFTWTLDGVDKDHLHIDPSTGALTFVQNDGLGFGPLPSYENPQDENDSDTPDDPDINAGDNKYHITVIATDDDTDDQKSTEYAVTITVTDEEEAGAIAISVPNDHDPPRVDDVITFTLSDPDGGIVLTGGDIDWTIEARRGTDPWVAVDDSDPTSLVKTYTMDEDDTGQELRATATYTDRLGGGKMAESDPTAVVGDERIVAPPRFRTGAEQTIDEGAGGRDTAEGITATDVDGEVLIWGHRRRGVL